MTTVITVFRITQKGETALLAHQYAAKATCPFCKAAAGFPCVNWLSKPLRYMHKARFRV